MAIARGQQAQDAAPRKLYMGIGAVKVIAVNPTKAELEKLYDREFKDDPTYLTETEIDGKKYPSVRITFIVQTAPEKNNGIDTIQQHTFFLRKQYRSNGDKTKYQVIDKYGRTAWGTTEEVKAKAIPQYASGPASIDPDYRPALVGEEGLTMFIKNYLNIPNLQRFVDGKWVDNPAIASKDDCLVRLDDIEKYFVGNFKELKELLTYQPDNLVKIAFGVRTSSDGRVYQTTYDNLCFKNGVSDYGKLADEILDRKSRGALQNSEFDITELHEYTVTPTPTSSLAPTNDAAPASAAEEESPW